MESIKLINQVEGVRPANMNNNEVQFNFVPSKAQYGGTDYLNAIRVERGISLQEALDIAANDPEIDYFFYTNAYQMVLGAPDQPYNKENDPFGLVTYHPVQGYLRIFHHGDVVFFRKDDEKKALGDAGPLADVYEKVRIK